MAKATLVMAGNTYKGEGQTLTDALKAIPLEFTQIKHKGTIRMEKDGKAFERFFTVIPLRRIFAGKIQKEHWASSVERFLK